MVNPVVENVLFAEGNSCIFVCIGQGSHLDVLPFLLA